MADISITANDVIPDATAALTTAKIGVTVTAGQVLVYDSVDGDWVLASNASAALSGGTDPNLLRFALSGGVAGQYISVARPGSSIDIGGVLTAGRWYVLSVAGAISPEADLTTGDFSVLIGYALTDDVLLFNPVTTGVQL